MSAPPKFQATTTAAQDRVDTGVDITERKRTEEALSQSEGHFRALAQALPQIVWTADAEGGIEWFNQRWYEYTGEPPGVGEGWSWDKVTYPDDMARTLSKWQEARQRGAFFENEIRLRRHDGHYHWFLVRAWPLTDDEGKVVRWFGTDTDIEQLKRIERLYSVLSRVNEAIIRIHDEQTLYEEVCRIVADAGQFPLVWIGLVKEGEVLPVAARGSATDYLTEIKVKVEGELGKGPTGTCIREDRPVVNDDFGTNPTTAPWRGPALCHRFRASAAFPLHRSSKVIGALTFYSARPGEFDAEHTKLLQALSADVSYALDALQQEGLREAAEMALRERERSLREMDERKNEFIAVLSHELRNPLAPIKNSLYILDRAVPGGAQAQRAKAVIGRQVELLSRLVDDLLDVTRIARNKVQLHRERLDLNRLVERALDDHRSAFEKNAVELELERSPIPALVHGDPARLTQVIGNLLQNAAKFTPRGGRTRLSVSTDSKNGKAIIRVTDTGVGMTPETLSRMFEPFMQADKTLDRSKGGLGLGLALVKGLIALHDGEVTAHSAGLGQGAEFVVRLPLDSVETSARTERVES
jgi:PAS domain S-box-containing protein